MFSATGKCLATHLQACLFHLEEVRWVTGLCSFSGIRLPGDWKGMTSNSQVWTKVWKLPKGSIHLGGVSFGEEKVGKQVRSLLGRDENNRSGENGPILLGYVTQVCSATPLSPPPTREKKELYADSSGHQPAPEPGEPMLQGSGSLPCQPWPAQLGGGAGAHQPRVCGGEAQVVPGQPARVLQRRQQHLLQRRGSEELVCHVLPACGRAGRWPPRQPQPRALQCLPSQETAAPGAEPGLQTFNLHERRGGPWAGHAL